MPYLPSDRELLDGLPPTLRSQVDLSLKRTLIERVALFHELQLPCLLDLVARMLPAAHFGPKQVECWERFMRGASGCMLLMYARVPVTSLMFLGRSATREHDQSV